MITLRGMRENYAINWLPYEQQEITYFLKLSYLLQMSVFCQFCLITQQKRLFYF